jgi:hypothetical protein
MHLLFNRFTFASYVSNKFLSVLFLATFTACQGQQNAGSSTQSSTAADAPAGTGRPEIQQASATTATADATAVKACDSPVNKKVAFSGYPASMTSARGFLEGSLHSYKGERVSLSTRFGANKPQLFAGGLIVQGKVRAGRLALVATDNGYMLEYRLKDDAGTYEGGTYAVGLFIDETPDDKYPHQGRVELAPNACVAQYSMDDGSGLISGGAGYLILN